jgi:hypothetical protein
VADKRSDEHKEGSDISPAERERREKAEKAARDATRRPKPEDESDDDRIDEASRESFPASDPPSIP